MASIDEFFARKWLHKSDLPADGSAVVLTIVRTSAEVMQDGERKLAAHFREEGRKPWLMNKTALKAVARIADTNDYTKWANIKVPLHNDVNFEFRGETGAIRVTADPQLPLFDDLPASFG